MKKYLKCIDDSRTPASRHFDHWVEINKVYTERRREGSLTGEIRVLLNEIKNPPVLVPELGGKVEPGFGAWRFVEVCELGLEVHEEETEKLAA